MADEFGLSGPLNHLSEQFAENARREARQRKAIGDAAQKQLSQARDAVEDLGREIVFFENALNEHEEARIVIIGGPAGTLIFPTAIAPMGMDRVRFEGFDDEGCRVAVVQHVSQLNVMLKATKVDEPARRIGFHLGGDVD